VAKRRTKKQKAGAKHPFLISWENEPENTSSSKPVKGQFKSKSKLKTGSGSKSKNAQLLDKQGYLASIKKDLFKSLVLAGFILALQIVIYLAWK
jgi:hypothetical protein